MDAKKNYIEVTVAREITCNNCEKKFFDREDIEQRQLMKQVEFQNKKKVKKKQTE